jgi:hypothetical protein
MCSQRLRLSSVSCVGCVYGRFKWPAAACRALSCCFWVALDICMPHDASHFCVVVCSGCSVIGLLKFGCMGREQVCLSCCLSGQYGLCLCSAVFKAPLSLSVNSMPGAHTVAAAQ